ncbi:MAG TPA: asparagine synthase-related protein [Polyangia bacterium]|jgi:asparagine synthase (glutamine-hydrolysing)
MPARLTGFLDLTGPERPTNDVLEAEWGARYPAPPPWRRTVQRVRHGTIFVDTCGGASPSDCLAGDQEGVGVAGAIRLDRRDLLFDDLPDRPVAGTQDPALVVRAYRQWGPGAFSRLQGDFAFVLWDAQGRVFYLVRDAFGVRRLQHGRRAKAVIFASDVEGILAWPGVDRTPDEVTILDNFLARYQTRERTFFRSIKRVLPGHHVRVGPSGQASARHALPPRSSIVFSSLEEYAEAFRHELDRAVAERAPSSGALVCQVSGGLDSASVASSSASWFRKNDRTSELVLASARFTGLASDEGGSVQELSRWLNVPVHTWNGRRPETSDLENSRLAWPFGRSSIAGSYQGDLELAERVDARVVFTGAGGNQIARESGFLDDCWRTGRWSGYLRGLGEIARASPWRWDGRHFRRTFLDARGVARAALLGGAPAPLEEPRFPDWIRPDLRNAWTTLHEETFPEKSPGPKGASRMADAIWEATANEASQVWTLEHEDARTTERGLEARHPYLSWSLLTLAMSIPWQRRAPSSHDRQLQRRALVGLLPERLRLRDTFVDFNDAILANCQEAAPFIERFLAAGPWASEGLVDRRLALDDFRRQPLAPRGAFAVERIEPWRRIRDVAALEAWLRRV